MNRVFILLPLLLLAGCSAPSQTATAPSPQFTPFAGLSADQEREVTKSRMKVLALAAQTYVDRNGDTLPDLSTPGAMQGALSPYLQGMGSEAFIHPVTGHAFTPNAALSKKPMKDIPDPSAVPLAWEADAASNQSRCVVWCDGHVKRLLESNWQTVSKAP